MPRTAKQQQEAEENAQDLRSFYDIEMKGNNDYDDDGELYEMNENSYEGSLYGNEQ